MVTLAHVWSGRAARPRPAASLIALWRDGRSRPHVFMGRRDASLAFLPGFLVFPGGRVERKDRRDEHRASIDPVSRLALSEEGLGATSGGFASAALRECYEETGLDLRTLRSHPLRYVARAITPPHLPIRYDTRFFLIDLSQFDHPPQPGTLGDGELLNPAWFPFEALEREPLHHVTRAVLEHAVSGTISTKHRLLVADRRPKRWQGLPPVRSRMLKADQEASAK